MRALLLLTLGIVGLASCTTVTEPPARDLVDNFRIVVDPAERVETGALRISATVTNTSKDLDFYANVGDGYNSELEQPTIFAAMGTQAIIERRVFVQVWEPVDASPLIEGSRVVRLSAGSSYRLVGFVPAGEPGTYRIRLDYSDRNDASAPTFHEYSATFRVW